MPSVVTDAASDLARLAEQAEACRACPLGGSRTRAVFGVGAPDADLMFVGEAPGFHEDQQGEPFVGAAGKLLTRLLSEQLGLQRSDVYIANVLKCRPPNNRDPLPEEIEACTPFLRRQLELVEPRVVVALGNFASRLLTGSSLGITKLRHQEFTMRNGTPLRCTFHPAAALRGGTATQGIVEDLAKVGELVRSPPAAPDPGAGQLGLFG